MSNCAVSQLCSTMMVGTLNVARGTKIDKFYKKNDLTVIPRETHPGIVVYFCNKKQLNTLFCHQYTSVLSCGIICVILCLV